MPVISVFYGIRIMMNLRSKEHNPPHIHAYYSGYSAIFYIADARMRNGPFPKRAREMVEEFISVYRQELLDMWNNGTYRKLKGID